MIPAGAVEAAALILHTHGGLTVAEARERAGLVLEAAAPHIRELGYEDGVQAVRDALLVFAEERDNALGAIRSHITTYELRKILGVEE